MADPDHPMPVNKYKDSCLLCLMKPALRCEGCGAEFCRKHFLLQLDTGGRRAIKHSSWGGVYVMYVQVHHFNVVDGGPSPW